MSSGNTETRILQMQLENKDFEDGVRQTIKSLENLEEKLNLKNAGDGFEKVSAAANSVQMGHLESGIDAVTNKFTLMGQIGLQVLERISTQIVNTGEKILRAATIQPMIDGWGEFEMKTNSVQTILGGIRNQFDDQPTAIHAISDALDELNEYADKTIYNFAQMTENVGKFTNQGIELGEATNAIKGIANWAAAVGANPQQMSRAMYNISQSLGAGSMQLIDWRSIRFANMATPEVKKLFAEVAKARGEIDENGNVKVGKQLINVMDDFESSLKGKWLTNEVMAEAFSIYAKAFSEEELVAKYGEELGHEFYAMGEYAEEAATKVRTFSQLIGVLQESLGSGWANTFDILFGGFEQQTEFLTDFKNRLEQIINFQTEDRNTWLQNFSDIGGIKVFQEVILKATDILTDFYWVFNDVAALVLNPFGSGVFNMSDGIFGPRQEGYTELSNTWEGVKGVFDDISKTLDNFQKWLYTPKEKSGRSPIHNLASALSGVAGAAGIAWQVLTGFGKFVFRIFKRFEPIVSSVLDLLGQIGGAIYNVFFNLTGQKSVEKIFDKLESAIGPVIDVVAGLVSGIIDLIHSLLGIDSAADDWTVLGERMKAFWEIFTYDPNLTFIDNFKNSLKKGLVSIFGEDTAASLIKAWDDNVAPVLEQISGFFEQAFGDLNRVIEGLRKASEADYSNADGAKGTLKTMISAFLEGYYGEDTKGAEEAYANVLDIYRQIKEYYDANVKPYVDQLNKIFTVDLPALTETIRKFLFGYDTTVFDKSGRNIATEHHDGLFGGIKAFFEGDSWKETVESVKGFFNNVRQSIWDAYNEFINFLFGKEIEGKRGNKWREGGLFQGIHDYFSGDVWAQNWEIITSAFNDVTNWIETKGKAAWGTISRFFNGYDTTVFDKSGRNIATEHHEGVFEKVMNFFSPVFDWLKEKGSWLYEYLTTHNFQQMWDGLNDLLFGYTRTVFDQSGRNIATEHKDGVLTPIIEMLRPISEAFEKVRGWALEKIGGIDWGGIWESIGRFFNGYDTTVFDKSGRNIAIEHHEGLFEKIASFFEKVIDFFETPEVQAFIGHIKTAIGWIGGLGTQLWTALGGLFSGQGFGAFEGVGTYLLDGFNQLKDKIFPEGFDLSGLLGGLLGGGNGDKPVDAKDAGANTTGQKGGWSILDLIMGTAEAAEADVNAFVDSSGNVVASLDQAGKATEKAADKGTGIFDSIMESVSPLLPYLGGAAAIGLAGKVGDMITGITGNRKPTIIEQIGGLIRTLGDAFKGLGILIGAAAIGEWVSPGTIDKVFDRITGLLDRLFLWIAGIGVGGKAIGTLIDVVGKKELGKTPGIDLNKVNFESVSSIISSIGTGIQGLFNGIQTLYNLAWEVLLADAVMGVDENDVYNFDKRVQRVLGFVIDIMTTFTQGEIPTLIAMLAKETLSGYILDLFGVETQSESMANILAGLGSFIGSAGDGIAAILTASVVPGIMSLDTQKIVDVINAVAGLLKTVLSIQTISDIVDNLAAIDTTGKVSGIAFLAKIGGAFVTGGLLWAVGEIAKGLINWYTTQVPKNLAKVAPEVKVFMESLSDAVGALASGAEKIPTVEGFIKTDLPRILKEIASDDMHFDKKVIDERGSTIRDFGTRVYNGIDKLAQAKEVFDKYNTGGSFPLAFFQEMTEALSYLKGDGIPELYDSVFGQASVWNLSAGSDTEKINGLNAFFSTLGSLGYVLVSYSKYDDYTGMLLESGQKLETTEAGLNVFRDAFSDIQQTFGELIGDVSKEGFDINKIKELGTFLTTIVDAGNNFATSFYFENGSLRYYNTTGPIMQMTGWLQNLGTGIRDLNNSLTTNGVYDIDYNQIESALKALSPLMDIEKTLYEYSKLMGWNGGLDPNTDWFLNSAEWIDSLPDMTGLGTKIREFATNVQTIAQETIDQTTKNDPVKLTVVPVIDDKNLGANLPEGMQMENTYSRLMNMQLNMSGVMNVRVDSSQIATLVTANNETRNKIDTLASAIRNIKINVNANPFGSAARGNRTIETYPLIPEYRMPVYEEP